MSTVNVVVPKNLGKYQVRGILGRGAMGIVYDGWDPAIGRRVAIKTVGVVDDTDRDLQLAYARFQNEARAAGRLSHPNIVGIYDYGEADHTAFIVMEFIEGRSLDAILEAEELPTPADAIEIMLQVLAALQFSHGKGVIHRDIKPGNVMTTADGVVKLADFGIARIESSDVTQAGTILGTPAYMSPEQLLGQRVDARSDIYAAGVLLYELLTGDRPFHGGLTAIIHKALNTTPPRPSEISGTVPPALDGVVAKAMAKRPEDRYADAAAFAQALRDVGGSIGAGGAIKAASATPSSTGHDEDDDRTTLLPPPHMRHDMPGSGDAEPSTATLSDAAAYPPRGRAVFNSPLQTPRPSPPKLPRRTIGAPVLFGAAAACVVALAGGGAWYLLRPPPLSPAVTANADPYPPLDATAGRVESHDPPASGTASPTTDLGPSDTATPPTGQGPPPAPVTAATKPAGATKPGGAPKPGDATKPGNLTKPGDAPRPGDVPRPDNATGPADTTPARPPAPRLAMVTPNPQALRDALAGASAGATCAMPRFTVASDGHVTVTGLVGSGAADAQLNAAVKAAIPGTTAVSWSTRLVAGPYCGLLDLIRPIAQPGAPLLDLYLADGVARLRRNDLIRPVVTMPDFPAFLIVDYFTSDGSVAHLLPARGAPARPEAANATARVKERLEVGPPFGTDMVVAIASSAPLFPPGAVRPDEAASAYLPLLAKAIDAAAGHGVRLSGRALPLDTKER